MVPNETCKASEIDAFYREAQRRGIYTAAQDSLIATWKTLSSSVLPSLGVDLTTVTVAHLAEQLPSLLQTYAAKSLVKASTTHTYEVKGRRLLADFMRHNGASDQQWFSWKQQSERRSAQARVAVNTRFNKKPDPPSTSTSTNDGEDDGGGSRNYKRHPLKLPGGRGAELQVPLDLRLADIRAMERQFTALMGYLQAQIDAETEEHNENTTQLVF